MRFFLFLLQKCEKNEGVLTKNLIDKRWKGDIMKGKLE